MNESTVEKPEQYTRILSCGMSEPLDVISFEAEIYFVVPMIKMVIADSEYVGITDINKYKIDVLKTKAKVCFEVLSDGILTEKVLLTKRKFHAAFPTFYDICPEYEDSFNEFMKKKS